MKTAIIIVITLFVALGIFGLYVKNSLGKIFDEIENEEPLDEKDVFTMFHVNENNE